MDLFRNKEFRKFFIIMISVASVFCAAALFISTSAGLLVAVMVLVLFTGFIAFSNYRYNRLKDLSAYIKRICAGDSLLDIRDNEEGELSILKSDIYKVTLMLTEYSKRLEKDKQMLSDLLEDISHQLKTPISSMTILADLLSDKTLPETKRIEFTDAMLIQLDRLNWLVDALLKMARLEHKAVGMRKDKIFVQDLMRKAVDSLSVLLDEKK